MEKKSEKRLLPTTMLYCSYQIQEASLWKKNQKKAFVSTGDCVACGCCPMGTMTQLICKAKQKGHQCH